MREVLSDSCFHMSAAATEKFPAALEDDCVEIRPGAPLDISSYQPPRPAASFLRPMADMDFFFPFGSPACISDQCALPVFDGVAALPPSTDANINVKRNNSSKLEPDRTRVVCWFNAI